MAFRLSFQTLKGGCTQGFLFVFSLCNFSEGHPPSPPLRLAEDLSTLWGGRRTPIPRSLYKRGPHWRGGPLACGNLAQGQALGTLLPRAPAILSLLRWVFCPHLADKQRDNQKVGDRGVRSEILQSLNDSRVTGPVLTSPKDHPGDPRQAKPGWASD